MRLSLNARQRVFVAIAGLLAISAPLTAASTTATEDTGRQMWVWDFSTVPGLLDVAQRYSVNRLLVWVSPGLHQRNSEIARLRLLQSNAAALGIHLDALSGDPSWASQPEVAAGLGA